MNLPPKRISHNLTSGQAGPLFTPGQMEFINANDFQALKLFNAYTLQGKTVQPLQFMIDLKKQIREPS